MPVRASGGAGPAKRRLRPTSTPSVGESTNLLAAKFAMKAGNRKAAAEHVAEADRYARSPGKQQLKRVASPREKFDEANRKSSGATVDAAGAGRVIAGHALGLGRASLPWNMPGTVAKTGKFIGESTLGLGALLARAQHAGSVMDNIKPHSDRESPVELGRALLGASGEHYSKKVGPAYRGDKGGVDHLAEEVFKDPAGSALDAVSVIAPLDLAATGTARAARAAAGRPGIKYIDERPDIRKAATGPAEAQRTARTVSGATVLKATDAARAGAQVGAKRLAARRAERAAASKATNRKPLPSVRAAVKPGEVAPLTAKSTAARHARKQSATAFAQGGARADYRTNEAIEPVVTAAKKTAVDNHYAARVASQFGIRDSAAAKAFLAKYIADIEARRAAALAGRPAPGRKVKGDAARVEYAAAQAAAEGELPALRALLADPRVFDDPGVHALAETLDQAGRKVEASGIVEPGRAALGRSKPRADVLGVKSAQELNATGRKAQVAEHQAARKEVKTAYKERDKARATGARVLAGARADLAKAKGRAEILSRNVSGKERIPGDKAAGRAPSYAGGGHGVRQAEDALAKAQAAVDAKVGGATERLVAARAQLKEARKPEPRIVETPQQFAAREQAAAAKLGLRPAGYVHAGLGDQMPKARTPGTGNQRANPLAKNIKRTGVLTKLGRNESTLGDTAKVIAAEIRKGTLDQAAGTMLRTHGVHVPDEAAAYQWARENGISDDSFRADLDIWRHAEPGTDKPQLYVVPKAQFKEWEALRSQEGTLARGPVGTLRRIASGAQAVLLGSNPGWWTLQRVNNAIALSAGRTNPVHYRELLRVRKTLTAAEREALATFTGGPSTRSFVGVNMFDDLGTLQRIIDNDPRYRATEKVKNVASVLLRSDAKLEHTVREMQLLNNLAKQIGPDVGTVLKAFRPAGRAMADGDASALGRMLSDEGYIRQLEEGVEALNRVHGSWASLTAQERRFKSFVAFYGFLRYATKLAFASLPVRHPLLTAMLLQEGQAEDRYYESVLGPDYPYARGTLLDSKGRSLGSMKRALPVAGGAMDLAQAISTGNITAAAARGLSPALAVVANTLSGQKLSLDASGEGRVSKPKFEDDEAIGGLFSSNRAKWLANQASTLLGPVQALNATDRRKQTDESLPWARSYQTRKDPKDQVDLDEDNAERQKQGGALGAGRSLAPLLFGTPGTGENLKLKADRATRLKQDEAYRKRKKKLDAADPIKQIKRDLAVAKEEMRREAGLDEVDRDLELLKREIELARSGG